MAWVLPVAAAKGGVGKTMLAANLAIELARQGRSVLAMDLDPQNALRFHLDIGSGEPMHGVCAASAGACGWMEAMRPARDGVVLMPYGAVDDIAQIAFEQQLAQQPHWLLDMLAALQLPPDVTVVIDTPPGVSVYLQQVLRVAHVAVVCLLADAASFATREQIERMIDRYARGRADFVGTAYILNQLDTGKRLSRDVLAALRPQLGGSLLGSVHQDQAVGEALASMLPVGTYAPNSQAARDVAQCGQRLHALLAQAAGGNPAPAQP